MSRPRHTAVCTGSVRPLSANASTIETHFDNIFRKDVIPIAPESRMKEITGHTQDASAPQQPGLERTPQGMEHNIALIPYLERMMNSVPVRFREEFELVRYRIQDAAQFPDIEPRDFCWLAQPNGTGIVPERETYFRGSLAYQIWTHWAGRPGIAACRVMAAGIRDGEAVGSIQPLDYAKHIQRLMAAAIPAVKVEVLFYSGKKIEISPESLEANLKPLFWEYGTARTIHSHPADEAELARIISEEHRRQEMDSILLARK